MIKYFVLLFCAVAFAQTNSVSDTNPPITVVTNDVFDIWKLPGAPSSNSTPQVYKLETLTNTVRVVRRTIEEYDDVTSTVPVQQVWWIEGGMWRSNRVSAIDAPTVIKKTPGTNIVTR